MFSYPLPNYKKILRAADEIGYTLKGGNVEDSRINISRQLRECILWFVEKKKGPWNTIPEL
jgi:hypothetical protein